MSDITAKELDALLNPFRAMFQDLDKKVGEVHAELKDIRKEYKDISEKQMKLDMQHTFTCKYQDQSMGEMNGKINGIQAALNEVREIIPDKKTKEEVDEEIEKTEKKKDRETLRIVWRVSIITGTLAILAVTYGLYNNIESKLKVNMDQNIALVQEIQKLKKGEK